jgi:hypothetical protein
VRGLVQKLLFTFLSCLLILHPLSLDLFHFWPDDDEGMMAVDEYVVYERASKDEQQ